MSACCAPRRWSRCCCCCSSPCPISACRSMPSPPPSCALVMNTSAFNCEVWRAALMNFPKDQYEAAQSVGMRAGQRFRRIVLPQIVRHEPARSGQRDVASDQGDAGPGGGGRRRYHARGGPDRRRNLRTPAAVPGRGGDLCRRSSSPWCPCSAGSSGGRSPRRPSHDPRFRHRLDRTRPAVERACQYHDPVGIGRRRRAPAGLRPGAGA